MTIDFSVISATLRIGPSCSCWQDCPFNFDLVLLPLASGGEAELVSETDQSGRMLDAAQREVLKHHCSCENMYSIELEVICL